MIRQQSLYFRVTTYIYTHNSVIDIANGVVFNYFLCIGGKRYAPGRFVVPLHSILFIYNDYPETDIVTMLSHGSVSSFAVSSFRFMPSSSLQQASLSVEGKRTSAMKVIIGG